MIETKRLLIRHFCEKDADECYQSWGKIPETRICKGSRSLYTDRISD